MKLLKTCSLGIAIACMMALAIVPAGAASDTGPSMNPEGTGAISIGSPHNQDQGNSMAHAPPSDRGSGSDTNDQSGRRMEPGHGQGLGQENITAPGPGHDRMSGQGNLTQEGERPLLPPAGNFTAPNQEHGQFAQDNMTINDDRPPLPPEGNFTAQNQEHGQFAQDNMTINDDRPLLPSGGNFTTPNQEREKREKSVIDAFLDWFRSFTDTQKG